MQILLGQRLTVWSKAGPIPAVVSRKAPHMLTTEERKKIPEFTDIWIDHRRQGPRRGRIAGHAGRHRSRSSYLCRDAQRPVHFAGPGRQGRRLDRDGNPAAAAWQAAASGRVLRLDGAGRDRPARRHHQRLRHPSRPSASRSMFATPPTRRATTRSSSARPSSTPARSSFAAPTSTRTSTNAWTPPPSRRSIPIQVRGVPKATGTDANAIQLAREGVAAGLVGIPNRYMHSPVEVVSLTDLDNAAKLLAEFCLRVTNDANWIP